MTDVRATTIDNGQAGIAIGEEDLFLAVEKTEKGWRFKLKDLMKTGRWTSWFRLKSPGQLYTSNRAKPFRLHIEAGFREDWRMLIDKIIAEIQLADAWHKFDVEEEKEEELPEPEPKEAFTPETVKLAEEFLNSANSLDFVNEALGDIYKEHKLRQTLFLLQLIWESVRISGETSTGKSHIVDRVMECFPKHWWVKYTGTSDKYLRYMAREVKTLYLAEFAAVKGKGDEESTAEYDMKIMMSEGKLKIGTVEKEGNKIVGTEREVEIKNFIVTSTDVQMAPELRNRHWEIATDRNINYDLLGWMGNEDKLPPWKRKNYEPLRAVLRCAIEKLEEEAPDEWWVPFMDDLVKIFKPLERRTDVRRNYKKLKTFITAVAKLNYRRRPTFERNGVKYGVALPEDFYHAWQLGDEAILGTLTEMTKRMEDVWSAAKLITASKKKLNSSTLSAAAGVQQDTAKGWLNTFDKMGLVVPIDRKPDGVLYAISELSETETVVTIEMNELYDSVEGAVKDIDIDRSMDGKSITITFPETVRTFDIRNLPDDVQRMAAGDHLRVFGMKKGQLVIYDTNS